MSSPFVAPDPGPSAELAAASDLSTYGPLLAGLPPNRRLHSVAVGRRVASQSHLVPARWRDDLVTAGYLHDIGYAHPVRGFHPLDGARFLDSQGYSRIVCHLVAHHSGSTYEAEERGIDAAAYRRYSVAEDLGPAHAVLWWADLTTGPTGVVVDVGTRLEEICACYGPEDVVTRFVRRARPVLMAAGQSPASSIQGVV